MREAGAELLPRRYVARGPAGAFEPGLEFGYADVVEGGVADFDAKSSGVERGFAAPVGAAELLQGDRARFVEGLGSDLGDVLDAVAVAEGDEVFAGLAHAGEDSTYLRFMFSCIPWRAKLRGRSSVFCNSFPRRYLSLLDASDTVRQAPRSPHIQGHLSFGEVIASSVGLSWLWRVFRCPRCVKSFGREGLSLMNRIALVLTAGLLMSGVGYAQASADAQAGASAQSQTGLNAQTSKSGAQASGSNSTSAQTKASAGASNNASNNSVALADSTAMDAALNGSLDAKKSKVGDRVEAETTQDVKENGKVVLRKGTRLVGHVTEVQAREKGQAKSELGVAFDRAELRNGQQMPLNASIQALAVAQSTAQASASAADDDAFASGGGAVSAAGAGAARGGGLVGGTLQSTSSAVSGIGSGVGSTANGVAGGAVNAAAHSTGAVGGLNATGALASNSRGVFGLDGMSLDAAASSATQGSMIVSNTKNVHLNSGTQMVLRVAGQAH